MFNWLKRPIRETWETFAAHTRHAAKELGSIFYGAGTNVQPAEYGMAWTKLPSDVAKGMHGQSPSAGTGAPAPNVLDDFLQKSSDRAPEALQPERRGPELDR